MNYRITSAGRGIRCLISLLSVVVLLLVGGSLCMAQPYGDEDVVSRRGFHLWPIFDFRTETGEDYVLRTRKVWPLYFHQRREDERGWYENTKVLDLKLLKLYGHEKNSSGSVARTVFPFSWGRNWGPETTDYFQFLLYRGERDVRGLNSHLLFPIFFQWRGESDKGIYLFPVWKTYTKVPQSDDSDSSWEAAQFVVIPIYSWSKDRVAVTPFIWKGESGHGFFPIYTVYDHGEGRNGWSFLWPLFRLHNDNEKQRRYFLWPLYSSSSWRDEHKKSMLFGMLYHGNSNPSYRSQQLLLVMQSARKIDPLTDEILWQQKTIFPLWSHRTDNLGASNYNFLNIFSRGPAVEGEKSVSVLMDLLMYRKSEGQYLNWNFINLPYTNLGGVVSYTKIYEQSIREPQKTHVVFMAPLYNLIKRVFRKSETPEAEKNEEEK